MSVRISTALLLLLMAFSVSADELKTLSGKGVVGVLAELTDTDITLKTDAGPVKTPLAQVLGLDVRAVKGPDAGKKYIDVRLIDDAVLHCQAVGFKGKDVELTLLSGVTLTLPLEFVESMVREAQDPVLMKQWAAKTKAKVRGDRVVRLLKEGDKVDLDPIPGTLGEVDAKGENIAFKIEGDKEAKPFPLERAHGLIFFRNTVLSVAPVCRVVDQDGNTLAATKLSFDGTGLNVTTAFGAKVALKHADLARLDFNLGKLTYLSDLEPSKVIERSGIGLITRYKKDTNLDGEPIILEKPHVKGVSIHAYTELEYNLATKFKDFKCLLGVDTRVGADSQPLVSIYCDGQKVFSKIVTPKATEPVALNVKDVATLRIVVSSRNLLDLHDHVTLADARVSQ